MKRKILIIFLLLVFVYCLGGVIYSVNVNKTDSNKDSATIKIKNYDYEITQNVSELYKKEFSELKNNLESSNINYDKFINSIAKLYIIDLYTLNGKKNKYDITSSQYVKESIRDNYKLKVSETIYKYLDGDENKNLPLVTEVNIESKENTIYTIESTEYEAYNIIVKWTYEEDLGYDTSAILTLIKDDNSIYVVEEKRLNLE